MAEPSDFARVFKGWNVWAVWQVLDLSFELGSIGLERDRRLRIWVEDALRLGAAGSSVADPLALKGTMIEVLPSEPKGLVAIQRKEDVGGTQALVVDGACELRFVRFFNRGSESRLVWPHDSDYLLEKVYQPSASVPATQGPAPTTISSDVGEAITPALGAVTGLLILTGIVGVIVIAAKR